MLKAGCGDMEAKQSGVQGHIQIHSQFEANLSGPVPILGAKNLDWLWGTELCLLLSHLKK